MEQILLGARTVGWTNSATRYYVVTGGDAIYTSESYAYQVVSTPGTIDRLRVKAGGAPGAGNTWTFTLYVNGISSGITCTLTNPNTECQDMVHTKAVVAGDRIHIKIEPDSYPVNNNGAWSLRFVGTNAKESLILGTAGSDTLDNVATEYNWCAHGDGTWDGTLTNRQQVVPTGGNIKNLYVWLSAAPGNGGTYRFTLMKNGTPQALTCDITDPATTGNDAVNSVAVVAGDLISLRCEPIDGPDPTAHAHWGLTFEATVDGESIVMNGHSDVLRTDFNEWGHCTGVVYSWGEASGATVHFICQPAVVKKLYVDLSVAPGDGDQYDFTIQKNEDSQTLTCNIAGAGTTGNDVANSFEVENEDRICIYVNPTDTPATPICRVGIVMGVAAPAPPAALKHTPHCGPRKKRVDFFPTLGM